MTSKQIIGGSVAVALFLAVLFGTGLTHGWLIVILGILAALAVIFVIGAEVAG